MCIKIKTVSLKLNELRTPPHPQKKNQNSKSKVLERSSKERRAFHKEGAFFIFLSIFLLLWWPLGNDIHLKEHSLLCLACKNKQTNNKSYHFQSYLLYTNLVHSLSTLFPFLMVTSLQSRNYYSPFINKTGV